MTFPQSMDLSLYGLLHLARQEKSAVNNKSRNFDRQIEVYLLNAIALAHSLQAKGIDFTLLTNQPEQIERQLHQLDRTSTVRVEGIDFNTNVPSGTKFYSAHFKIDVFTYLSSLPVDRYVGLVDLDIMAISEIPAALAQLISDRTPIYYDITTQVIPTYGHNVILRDLQKLVPQTDTVSWSGGEFIAGTPDFFRSLAAEIKRIYPIYLQSIDSLHHQGDEMLTSAALTTLRQAGTQIVDGGTLGIVSRFWSYPPQHEQLPFDRFERVFLLHLPSDKQFLAKLSPADAQQRERFLDRYRRYLITKIPLSTLHQQAIALSHQLRRVAKFRFDRSSIGKLEQLFIR